MSYTAHLILINDKDPLFPFELIIANGHNPFYASLKTGSGQHDTASTFNALDPKIHAYPDYAPTIGFSRVSVF